MPPTKITPHNMLEFIFLSGLAITTRFFDLALTFIHSPNLEYEANPVVAVLHLSWTSFIVLSLFLLFVVIAASGFDLFVTTRSFPSEKHLSFGEFAAMYWFGRMRHPIFFLLAFAKDHPTRLRFIGYGGIRLLIGVGVIAACNWLLLDFSPLFSDLYSRVFPFYPYGFIVLGAILLLFLFLKREYAVFQSQFPSSPPSGS